MSDRPVDDLDVLETAARAAEQRGAAPMTADIITRLRAVVATDDAIQHAYRESAEGRAICPRVVWRGLYADRERADRELWGTCADERAACARRLLEVLDERMDALRRMISEVPRG